MSKKKQQKGAGSWFCGIRDKGAETELKNPGEIHLHRVFYNIFVRGLADLDIFLKKTLKKKKRKKAETIIYNLVPPYHQ